MPLSLNLWLQSRLLVSESKINECIVHVQDFILLVIPDSLLHAVKCGHCPEAEFLLSECHANPNMTDKGNTAFLTLAKDSKLVVQLLKHGAQAENVYKTHSRHIGELSSEQPLDNVLSVFITGNRGAGKSTFIKSIVSTKGLKAFFSKSKPVSDVDKKTVGIIPYEIVTKEFGRIICYDFAGYQEFYTNDCAVLQMLFELHHQSSSILLILERVSRRLSVPLPDGWLLFKTNAPSLKVKLT